MYRCVCALLVAQLGLGCSTVGSVDPVELRQQFRSSRSPIALRAQDGSTMRLDPNTELRFHLRGGGVTRWVCGNEIWHSPVGLSFGEREGVFLLQWEEIAGAEVSNLSSGKTAAAIVVTAVVVGVVVIAVVAALSDGGGGGDVALGAVGLASEGASKGTSRRVSSTVARPRRHHRTRGGVHVHVPLAMRVAQVAHEASYAYPSPPMAHPPDAIEEEHPSSGRPPVAPGVPSEVPTLTSSPVLALAGPTLGGGRPVAEVPASPLFDEGMRRRFSIQFVASAAAGTELVRLDRYSGSLYLGMRLKDAFELGGGVRHFLAPVAPSIGAELRSSVVGFGRVGAHLGFGVSKSVAVALSLDAGSGLNSAFHLRTNIGLRVKPTRMLSIGVFPFNPTFNYFHEDSPYRGALRWTFPTTLEVAFNY